MSFWKGQKASGNRKRDYIMIDKDSDAYTLLEQFRCLDTKDRGRLLGYAQALTDGMGQQW